LRRESKPAPGSWNDALADVNDAPDPNNAVLELNNAVFENDNDVIPPDRLLKGSARCVRM
jgi:hypothetical protein